MLDFINNGQMTKMKITAYSDASFSSPMDDGVFIATINPEKYSLRYNIVHNDEQAQGTSANASKYVRQEPGNLNFDFVFDRTGAMREAPPKENGVIDDIEGLKRVILTYQGEQHRSNYLELSWGSLLFKCTLVDLSLEYKVFKPNGAPIRAVAKCTFKEFVEDDLRVAQENAQSPDLTHIRMVKKGDTLPLMAYRIYGDAKYYLDVARINQLTNFRKLEEGQELFFPPLEKTKA